MDKMISKMQSDDMRDVVMMALDLWKDNTYNEMKEEFEEILKSDDSEIYLYKEEDAYVGFIHVSIRQDYVEGSNSSPVGYVEGIYVKPDFRGKKIAKELLSSGEQWALSKDCSEMGSDIEQDNTISYEFHRKVGFKEANRVICFIKDI